MPITFAQPEPMAPAVTANAAAAEFAAKTFPTIAQIYENAARIRASAGGGGGGGHGGVVQGGGPIQVLPSGDGGAGLYQVEAQANREQRALDLGFEAQQDPVARHLQLQHQFKLEQSQQEQQNQNQQMALLNPMLNNARGRGQVPPQSPQPPPVTFGPADETKLAGTIQAISDLDLKSNTLIPSVVTQMMGPLEQQRDQLLAKKRKADEDAKQQQIGEAAKDQANARGLLDMDMRHAGQNGFKQVPELITPIYDVDKTTGKKYMVNHEEFKASAEAAKDARAENSKLALEQEKARIKDPIVEQKLEHAAIDKYLDIRKHEIDRLHKEEDQFMKDAEKSGGSRVRATPEGFDNTIAERMKAHGLAATVQDAINQHRAGRGQPAQPTQDDRQLMKQANPEAVSALSAHVSTMPRLATGQPDLLSATPQQLNQLEQFYSQPKAIGASPETAAKWKQAINQARAARQQAPIEDFDHPAPGGAVGEAIDTFGGGTGMAAARVWGRAMANAPKTARALPGAAASTAGAIATLPQQAQVAGRAIHNEASAKAGAAYLNFKRWLSGE